MIRFIARFLGLLIFAAAFIALIADGIRSIAADRMVLTPLEQTWMSTHDGSLNRSQEMVQSYLHPYLWDPVIQTMLHWPTFAVVGVLGILLMLAGARWGGHGTIRSI
jgi:hypothetical protein